MASKVYKIGGTLWTQKELTYGEDLELRPVLKLIADKFGSGEPNLGDVIDSIFDGKTLPEFLRVVLKPYEPTPAHRLYNALAARIKGVDRDNVVLQMPNSQLAEVLADFFMLNTSWIGNLPGLQSLSALSLKQ